MPSPTRTSSGAVAAERMSAPPGEAAKVRLPQRFYGAAPVRRPRLRHDLPGRSATPRRRRGRGGLCSGRPLTGVRTLGDVIGAYRWLKANELIPGVWRYEELRRMKGESDAQRGGGESDGRGGAE